MKKILLICLLSMFALTCMASETKNKAKVSRDWKIIGRDYNIFDDPSMRPFSFGLTSWTDKEHGTDPALYGSVALLSYKEMVRFECGGAATFHKGEKWADIAMVTGLSTLIADRIVLGVWYSPFWNLYDKKHSDDPWGVMIGYSIPLGKN